MRLEVKGMSCGHCVARVKKALERVAGVARAEVDLARGEATVEGTAPAAPLIAAVQAQGYAARELAGEPR